MEIMSRSQGPCCSEATAAANAVADAVNKAHNTATSLQAASRLLWKKAKDKGSKELDDMVGKNDVLAAQLKGALSQYEEGAAAAYDADKDKPQEEAKRGAALNKAGVVAIKANLDNWEDDLKKDTSSFGKESTRQNKEAAKFYKDVQKKLKEDLKLHEGWQKKFEGKTEKQISKEESSFEKEKVRQDRNIETWDEAAQDQAQKFSELNEDTASEGEALDAAVAHMVDGSNGEGLGAALEAAETVSESFYQRTDMELERIEGEKTIEVNDMVAGLSEVIKEHYAELAEHGDDLDETIGDLASMGARTLAKLSATTASQAQDIKTSFSAQRRALEKVEKAVKGSELSVRSAGDENRNIIDDMTAEATKIKHKFAEGTDKSITNMVDAATTARQTTETTLGSYLKREANTVGSDAEVAIDKVNQAFDQQLDVSVDEIENAQKTTDETGLVIKQDANTVKFVGKTADELTLDVEEFNDVAKGAEDKGTATLADVEHEGAVKNEELQKTSLDTQKTLQRQAGTAMQDIATANLRLNAESSHGLEDILRNIDGVKKGAFEFSQKLRTDMRPVAANLQESQTIMTKVQQGLNEARTAVALGKQQTEEKLSEQDVRITNAKDELLAEGKKTFDGDRTYASGILETAQNEIESSIGHMAKGADASTANANQVLNDAQAKEGEALKQEQARSVQLSALYEGEQQKLKGAEEFPALATERISKFEKAQKNLTAAEQGWEVERTEVKTKMKLKLGEDIRDLDAEHENNLNNLKGKIADMSADEQQKLSTERTQGQAYFQTGQADITKVENRIDSDYKGIADRAKTFGEAFDKDTTNDDALARADKALKSQVAVGEDRLKMEGDFDKSFGDAQGALMRDVNDEALARNEALRKASAGMQQEVQQMKGSDEQEMDALRGAFGAVSSEISQRAHKSEASEADLRGRLSSAQQGIRNDVQHESAALRARWTVAEDAERATMGAIGKQAMGDARERANAGSEASNVGRDIEKEARNVDFETHDMMQVIAAILPSIDPTNDINLAMEQMGDLKKLMKIAQSTAGEKESEADKQVIEAVDRMDAIVKDAKFGTTRLNMQVKSATGQFRKSLSTVGALLASSKTKMDETMKQTTNLLEDFNTSVTSKIGTLKMHFDDTSADVAAAENVGKYQGDDALQKVIEVVQGAQNETDKLTFQQEKVITPSVTSWRKKVEDIFESLGVSLDLDRVSRMAAESMENDEGGILGTRESMERKARAKAAALAKRIAEIRTKSAAMIAAVMADASLSEHEKQIKIMALKAAADKAAYELQMKARGLMNSQGTVIKNIDDDISKLGQLTERAALLANGHDGSEDHNRQLLDIQQELKGHFATIRKMLIDGHAPESLLEVSEESDQQLESELHATLMRAINTRLASSMQEQSKAQHLLESEIAKDKEIKEPMSGAEKVRELEANLRGEENEMEKEDSKWDRALDAIPGLLHSV